MGIRKSYMKLCQHGNTEVTYVINNGKLEVTFEQAVSGGFRTAILDERSNVVSNHGFNGADIGYFQRFLARNIETIKAVEFNYA